MAQVSRDTACFGCWRPSSFPLFAFHISVFYCLSFRCSSSPLDFIRVSSLRPAYLQFCTHSIVPLHADGNCPGLALALVPDVVVPEAEHWMRMKQKSRFKFLLWPGFEPRTSQYNGRERYHLTTAHTLLYKCLRNIRGDMSKQF